MKVKKSVVLTASLALIAGATYQPAFAKSVTLVPITCSSPDVNGSAIFLRQGSSFTLGLSGTGPGAVGNWHHLYVVDNGAQVLVDVTIPSTGPSFNLTTTSVAVPKGHLITLEAHNLDNNITCTFQFSTSRV